MPTVYEVVTQRIIQQLEQGVAPWQKPWNDRGAASLPKNLATGKEYRGINTWILFSTGYASPYFLTFKQALELGGNVRKGEKGYPVVFWKFGTREVQNPDTHETENKDSVLCRYYTVFNVAQCENLRVMPQPKLDFPETSPIDACESIVAGWETKPDIRHGHDKAAYYKLADYITMPDAGQFAKREEYYSTLFHELTHSTGHKTRLDRATLNDVERFGDKNYSREELVAEMGAAFLCGLSGIENATIDNSAAYLSFWLKELRENPRTIVIAAAQAQKAVDMITGAALAPVEASHV